MKKYEAMINMDDESLASELVESLINKGISAYRKGAKVYHAHDERSRETVAYWAKKILEANP